MGQQIMKEHSEAAQQLSRMMTRHEHNGGNEKSRKIARKIEKIKPLKSSEKVARKKQ